MSYAHGGKREGIAAQGNAVGPAEGKQIEQPQQTQGALANGDGLARQLRQAQEALANGDVLAKRSCGKCKRRSPMEMCWRRTAAASARGARQWRCAGEEQLWPAQEALANGDVLAKSRCGKCKGRSPMEMCLCRWPCRALSEIDTAPSKLLLRPSRTRMPQTLRASDIIGIRMTLYMRTLLCASLNCSC